jgi:HD-like signal output (HDOD) protein/CheY-like chemotaxis protein
MQRALIVDDEPAVHTIVGLTLCRQRISCDFAEDGAAARRKLDSGRYDIVITDMSMPNVNGHSLCQSVLARPDRPLLVAMTGIADPRLQRDLKSRGVDAFFQKPLELATFGSRVREMLDKRLPIVPVDRNGSREQPTLPALCQSRCPRTQTVAILFGDQMRATELAAELGSEPLRVFVADTTDALCSFTQQNPVDVLLIENVPHGFLSATEILGRLKSPRNLEAIVVGQNPVFSPHEVRSLAIRQICNTNASVTELVKTVRHTLANAERIDLISARARALVGPFEVPFASPEVFLKLAEYSAMSPAQISIPKLAEVIMADAATKAELVRLANGSHLGMRRRITEVTDSLAYLGPSRAVTLLLARGAQSADRGLLQVLPAEMRAWCQSRMILAASVSSVFAERYFNLPGDTAFILGWFQEMGIAILARTFGERYLKVLDHARQVGPVRLHVVEQQSFGMNHAEVSAALIDHWGFPEKLVVPIGRHHESGRFVDDRNDYSAFLRPMCIAEAFADFWDNRHPTRKDLLGRLLADCAGSRSCESAYQESFDQAVTKMMDLAALFGLPRPDERSLLTAAKEGTTRERLGKGLPGSATPCQHHHQ